MMKKIIRSVLISLMACVLAIVYATLCTMIVAHASETPSYVDTSDYTSNHASKDGGAIYWEGDITNNEYTNNYAPSGGAIYKEGFDVYNGFANNDAPAGGAIYKEEYDVYGGFIDNTPNNPRAISFDEER